jgi:hypothetical protein
MTEFTRRVIEGRAGIPMFAGKQTAVRARQQSQVEKHQQSCTPAKKPRAGGECDGLSAKLQIALKAKRVDLAERLQSRQEDIDRRAVERAENEGMMCPPRD